MSSQFRCAPSPDIDADLVYRVAAESAFDGLKNVAAQLAGLLVLRASGASAALPGHLMLMTAIDLLAETVDSIHTLRPRGERACFHRYHLLKAADLLELAVARSSLVWLALPGRRERGYDTAQRGVATSL